MEDIHAIVKKQNRRAIIFGCIITLIALCGLAFGIYALAMISRGELVETYCQQEMSDWWEENYSASYELHYITYSVMQTEDGQNGETIGTCVATAFQSIKNDPYITSRQFLITINYYEDNPISPERIMVDSIIEIDIRNLGN